ncbi:MAG: ABC transporter permease [Nitrososphaerota archaeon]
MSLRALIHKELKELLMEKTILVGVILMPLLLFPTIGGILSFTMIETTRTGDIETITLAVNDLDKGTYSKLLVDKIKENKVEIISDEGFRSLDELFDKGVVAYLEIPKDFTERISEGVKSKVYVYYNVKTVKISSLVSVSKISGILSNAYQSISRKLAEERGVDLDFLSNPIQEESNTFYRGDILNYSPTIMVNTILSTVYGLPLVALIVVALTATISATSIGLEKEAKTLEILLTLPISRLKILFAKMLASTIIALIGMFSFVAGFGIYLMLAFSRIGNLGELSSQGENFGVYAPTVSILSLSSSGAVILMLTIFVAMLLTMSIGILVGVLAEDVRGSQQLVGAATFLPMFPAFFLTAFINIDELAFPASHIMMLNPYTHFFRAIDYVYAGKYLEALSATAVTGLFTLVFLTISAWLFSGEKLITLKVSLKKKREALER